MLEGGEEGVELGEAGAMGNPESLDAPGGWRKKTNNYVAGRWSFVREHPFTRRLTSRPR